MKSTLDAERVVVGLSTVIVRFLAVSVILSAAFVLYGVETLPCLQPMSDTYLESSGGGGGINTGYYVTSKTRIEADYRVLSTSGTRYLYGCLWPLTESVNLQYGHFCQFNSGVFVQKMSYYDGARTQWTLSKEMIGEGAARYRSVFNLKGHRLSVKMQDVEVDYSNISSAAILPTSGTPLAIFSSMSADGQSFQSGNMSSIRLYSLAIYEDDVLVRDYIPYGSGAVTGLLDRCTGKVYQPTTRPTADSPLATNNFKIGTDEGHVRSISGTILQGLDTGIVAKPTTKIDVSFTLLNPAANESVFGVDSQDGGLQFDFRLNENKDFCWNFQDEQQTLTSTGVAATPADRRIVFDGPGDTITMMRGTKVEYTATISTSLPEGVARTQTSGGTIQLFCRALHSADGNATVCTGRAYMQIRAAKIWDNGTLVRDYAPRVVDNVAGLYDSVSGTFFSLMPSYVCGLDCGGAIPHESKNGVGDAANGDAYISGMDAYIVTDYHPNSKTRIEADYQVLATNGTHSLFGCCNSDGLRNFYWYMQNGAQRLALNDNGSSRWLSAKAPVDGSRCQTYVDLATGKYGTYSGGVLVGTGEGGCAMSANVSSKNPMAICANVKTDGSIHQTGYFRLYGLKVYDNGVLVRNYVPASQNGNGGLWETCNRRFWGSASAQRKIILSGAGTNGVGRAFSQQPVGCTIQIDGANTLEAFAPTAVGYQWYENGKPIAGATGTTLTVHWKRPRTNTYFCKAFFADFGLVDSQTVTAVSDPAGLVLMFF